MYEGLTPAGLAEALRINRPEHWPTTFNELDSVGIGARVLEWLELCIGAGHAEKYVVRAFLEVVHSLEFTLRQAVAAALGKRKPASGAGQTLVDLEQVISEALSSATAEQWPSAILDYAEVKQLSA